MKSPGLIRVPYRDHGDGKVQNGCQLPLSSKPAPVARRWGVDSGFGFSQEVLLAPGLRSSVSFLEAFSWALSEQQRGKVAFHVGQNRLRATARGSRKRIAPPYLWRLNRAAAFLSDETKDESLAKRLRKQGEKQHERIPFNDINQAIDWMIAEKRAVYVKLDGRCAIRPINAKYPNEERWP